MIFVVYITGFNFWKQGTIVDRIDHNIQNVAASVDDGLKQLQKVVPNPWIILKLCFYGKTYGVTVYVFFQAGQNFFYHIVLLNKQFSF